MELWKAGLAREWGPVITAIVTLSAALSSVLSSRSASPIVQAILDVISVAAFNIGSAKNADDDR